MDLGLPQLKECVPPISILSAKGDSLRRALEVEIESLRDDIRGSSDIVSTMIGSLMQS